VRVTVNVRGVRHSTPFPLTFALEGTCNAKDCLPSWIPQHHARPPRPLRFPVSTAPLKSIVLVDDEKSYTDLMAHMLAENLNCPVHAFFRPLEALAALPALDPAVIVTDYYMPQLNGLELIRQAATVAPQAVFVLISGHNLDAAEDEIARLNALRGVLAKPFGWRKLAEEILRVWPQDLATPSYRAGAPSL
jgi:DNA-binding NtrC family response regulator